MVTNLGYDDEHAGLENLATKVGCRRRKERGTGDDAVEAGLFADMLARVLRGVCNGGGTTNFELGQVLALVCAGPAEECKPLFAQTLAFFGRAWGTPRNEAKASLVRERDGLGSRGLRGRRPALGKKRSARVHRRYRIGQRTTNGHCRLESDGD